MPEQKKMMKPHKKASDMFLCSLQINVKKRAKRGSVLQATYVLLKIELFLTQLFFNYFSLVHLGYWVLFLHNI